METPSPRLLDHTTSRLRWRTNARTYGTVEQGVCSTVPYSQSEGGTGRRMTWSMPIGWPFRGMSEMRWFIPTRPFPHITPSISRTGDRLCHEIDYHAVTLWPIKFVEDTSNFLFKFQGISDFVPVNSCYSVSPWKSHAVSSRKIEVVGLVHRERIYCRDAITVNTFRKWFVKFLKRRKTV